MRFTTASGTKYEISDIEANPPLNPVADAVYGEAFEGILVRDGLVPIIDIVTGSDMAEIAGQRVIYFRPPLVGERFVYFTDTHGRVTSTPVVEIEESV